MKIAIVLLSLLATAYGIGDTQCTSQGGTCQNWIYYKCTAGYETGLCSGDSDNRCCFPCNALCVSTNNGYDDSTCTNAGGECWDDSNYCPDGYTSGMCDGPSSRNCCGASSSGGGSTGGSSSGGFLGNCYTDHGNVMDIASGGCSSSTASQDGYSSGGVSSSDGMAETDASLMSQYKTKIDNSADSYCVQPGVIAGIISRESRAGAALDSQGYGDNGNGYGLMQIDVRYHTPVGGPYSQQHIDQGTGILMDMISAVASDHPTWDDDMNLKGGICAYNSGPGNVQTYSGMDVGTTGNDYSDDVVARAQYYIDYEGY